jgi:hypothetical protein
LILCSYEIFRASFTYKPCQLFSSWVR